MRSNDQMDADLQSELERQLAEGELMAGMVEEEEQPGMDAEEILRVVSAELENSRDENAQSENKKALDYYLGNPRGDEKPDRSQVQSTDVADAIEWILPQAMDAMTAKGAVVHFEAISEDDEEQADLETEFTHYVFMQQNEGFLNLYQMMKDALLMSNGVLKIWYDEGAELSIETYNELTYPEVQQMRQFDDVEILRETHAGDISVAPAPGVDPMPVPVYNVEVRRAKQNPRVRVEVVPPEEFRVNAGHPSPSLKSPRFTAHITERTASELILDGHDPQVIRDAPAYSMSERKEARFAKQGESIISDYLDSPDDSQKLIQIIEAYMQIDVNGDGVAELMKITAIGDDFEAKTILDVSPIAELPFVSAVPIIMPHKYRGLNVWHRLVQIQDSQTSLLRNTLDNVYLQNNREKEVVEGLANIDDLLISRPGGIKRVKQAGAIRELQVQPIGTEAMAMMDYFDKVRAGRVGVSPDMSGQALPVGQETAHGVERVMTAAEALVGLMIRSVAETGLKAAYLKIRNLLVRYQDSGTPFKFRDQWMEVNPSSWGERSRMTVNVGTGTGDDMRRQAALQVVLSYQEKLVADPRNTLVDQQQIYNALDDLADAAGLGGADSYFLNPASPRGQEKKQQTDQQNQETKQIEEQAQQALQEAQTKLADAEMGKAQAQLQSSVTKAQNAQLQAKIDVLEGRLKLAQESAELQFKYDQMTNDTALKLTELETAAGQDLSQQNKENKDES